MTRAEPWKGGQAVPAWGQLPKGHKEAETQCVLC